MTASLFLFLLLAVPLSAAVNPRVEFALGVLEESRCRPEADRRFEAARLADPLALPLVQRAVNQRLDAGNRADAVKLFTQLAAARPNDLNVQLLFADFLETEGDGDALATRLATQAMESALKQHPRNPAVIRRLHSFYLSTKRRSDAEDLLEKLDPRDAESALLYGSLRRSSAEQDESKKLARLDEHYQSAMAAHPENSELARTASDYFRESGRPFLAIEMLERHVAAAPSSLELHTRLGILHFAAKQHEQGEAVLKRVLEIHPKQALPHQALAKFYRSQSRPELARYHASELLKIRGGSTGEFLKLANEWLDANDPRAARLLLERAVFLSPNRYELLEKLAIATRRDPETRENAARIFREAEAAKPESVKNAPAFLIESAETLIAQGQSKAGEEKLRTAIKSFPPEAKKETAAALRRLAQLWESEKRNLNAARALRLRADGLER